MANQELGEILGDRYQIKQQLGRKAGRRTLLAQDLQTQELVVVKLLSFNDEFEWNDLKLFEREAETLKAISHPAIPCYLDYFELDLLNSKGFALVQSYIAAKSLEEQIKSGRSFSEIEVKQLAKAILEILTYLHGRQPPVIHRDIKPSNILLTNRSGNSVGQVYLVDFGSVQIATKRSSTMTVVGTYGYMPPEQFGGRANSSSDLYSLGATLIYLVTGQHPADLPQTDLRIEFEKAAKISFGFTNWLKKMTEPILSRRFASAESALQALEKREIIVDTKTTQSSINKPAGSRVVLTTNANSFEIIIPSVGLGSGNTYTFLFGSIVMLLCAKSFWNTTMMYSSQIGSSPIIWFTIWAAFIYGIYLLFQFFLRIFGRVRFRIAQRQVSLKYEIFGFELYSPPSSPRQNIIRLERTKDTYNLNPYLVIWAGTRKYKLCNSIHFALTPPEIDWLAQELSDWLDLPIAKD